MLRWDGMGWAALVTQCISMEAFVLCCTALVKMPIALSFQNRIGYRYLSVYINSVSEANQ